MTLLETERAKYEEVWGLPEYRVANHGLLLWNLCRKDHPGIDSALDIGCGNGRLFSQWNAEGIDGHGVDFAANSLDLDHPQRDKFTIQCLWDMAFYRRFDFGMCADVMEHIPPEKVDAVIARIATACNATVFKVANYPSAFGCGQLHLSLHDAAWWLAKIGEFGRAEHLPQYERRGIAEYVIRFVSGVNT